MVNKFNDFALRPGDIVEVVAVSSSVLDDEVEAVRNFLESQGLVPRIDDFSNFNGEGSFLYANDDMSRFAAFKKALESKDSKAIWFIKGGHGASKLLRFMKKLSRVRPQKLLIGFSDVTVLLNYMVVFEQFPALYGAMLNQIVNKAVSSVAVDHIVSLAMGKKEKLAFNLKEINLSAKEFKDNAEGIVTGGCLSLLQSFIGTKAKPDFKDTIILLEDDRFETPQRVDRIFDHMIRADFFDGCKAVILGNFLEGPDLTMEQKNKMAECYTNLGRDLDNLYIPLYSYDKFGHGMQMEALPLGIEAKIENSVNELPVLRMDL